MHSVFWKNTAISTAPSMMTSKVCSSYYDVLISYHNVPESLRHSLSDCGRPHCQCEDHWETPCPEYFCLPRGWGGQCKFSGFLSFLCFIVYCCRLPLALPASWCMPWKSRGFLQSKLDPESGWWTREALLSRFVLPRLSYSVSGLSVNIFRQTLTSG